MYVLVAHRGQEPHVLTNLFVVFGLWTAELEVDNCPLVAVGHDAVGAALHDVAIFDAEDGTLVEECPAGREPVGHLRVLQPLAQQSGNAVECQFVVVDDALLLQLVQGVVDVGCGADGGEYAVQNAANLDIVVAGVLVVVADEVAALVALAELGLQGVGGDGDGAGE